MKKMSFHLWCAVIGKVLYDIKKNRQDIDDLEFIYQSVLDYQDELDYTSSYEVEKIRGLFSDLINERTVKYNTMDVVDELIRDFYYIDL